MEQPTQYDTTTCCCKPLSCSTAVPQECRSAESACAQPALEQHPDTLRLRCSQQQHPCVCKLDRQAPKTPNILPQQSLTGCRHPSHPQCTHSCQYHVAGGVNEHPCSLTGAAAVQIPIAGVTPAPKKKTKATAGSCQRHSEAAHAQVLTASTHRMLSVATSPQRLSNRRPFSRSHWSMVDGRVGMPARGWVTAGRSTQTAVLRWRYQEATQTAPSAAPQ